MAEDKAIAVVEGSASLDEVEAGLERHLLAVRKSFIEVGRALQKIHDERLYAEKWDTFEAYCLYRWPFTREHAYRMIDAARVAALLPIGDTPSLGNESQARELVRLKDDPETMAAAWGEANERAIEEGKPVTAEMVRDAVSRRMPDRKKETGKVAWHAPSRRATRLEQIRTIYSCATSVERAAITKWFRTKDY